MRLDWDLLPGLHVTIMGLGLHGGGAATASFFARHGSEVTVTDLRSKTELAASIEKLSPYSIRFVLGRHDARDFTSADIVVKNPAVSPTSPYLKAARRIESDISIFLALSRNPLIGVTGTKGKSTTSSAIHHVLKSVDPRAKIGGNITVSPLSFVDELRESDESIPVVLELSSWQLADLRGGNLLKPRVAVVTNILKDHMNRYSGMDEYVADKMVIVENQSSTDFIVCDHDDPYSRRFVERTPAQVRYFSGRRLPEGFAGGWLENGGRTGLVRSGGRVRELLKSPILLPGKHNGMNLLAAGLALSCSGIPDEAIRAGLASFPGIKHRLEFVAEIRGRRYYNDSAATIPEATAAALESFPDPVVLIAGGTDKELDFGPLRSVSKPPRNVILLAGSASRKLETLLAAETIPCLGPFDSIDDAVRCATELSKRGDVILLSPGCASFEFFKNEFDRGDGFVRAVGTLESEKST